MRTAILLSIVLCVGCASRRQVAEPVHPIYADNPSAALVFSPPAIDSSYTPFLARDERTAGAFLGYEELSTTYYMIRTDDRQYEPDTGILLRRAVSERIGVSYR